MIPMSECIKGRLYKVRCRNLKLAIYDGEGQFIGIRTKFDRRFLDSEDHEEMGPPYGTVRDIEDTGIDTDIQPSEFMNPELFEWLEKMEKEHGISKNS